MRAVVVYESMFGSTKKVAEAIAEGLAECAEVSVVPVTSAGTHILDGTDLVVVGGPTHTHGMSRPGTRKMAGKRAGKPGSEAELVPGAVSGPGVREWLASLGRLEVAGAAFDTFLAASCAPGPRTDRDLRPLPRVLRPQAGQAFRAPPAPTETSTGMPVPHGRSPARSPGPPRFRRRPTECSRWISK